MKAKDLINTIRAKLNIRPVSRSLPSLEESAIVALKISDELKHNEQEQAMFVAGFQEGIKYIKQGGNVR